MDISTISVRTELPAFFVRCGFLNGAEIGVQKGEFSKQVTDEWKGKLYLIDPWKHYDSGYTDYANKGNKKQELFFRIARRALRRRNVEFIRKESVEAAKDFSDGSLDWIHIDANHSKASVSEDIATWWPKVAHGGLVTGHDYIDADFTTKKGNHIIFGVKSAVDEFLSKLGLTAHATVEKWPTWIVVKP